MNEVYTLTVTKEVTEEHPEVQVLVYQNMEGALKAYSVAVDQAREEAENYASAREEHEIVTDSYRWFQIVDTDGCESITIEVETKEIIGDDSDDI